MMVKLKISDFIEWKMMIILVLRLGEDINSVKKEMKLGEKESLKNTKILDVYYLEESLETIKETIKKNLGLKSWK